MKSQQYNDIGKVVLWNMPHNRTTQISHIQYSTTQTI